MQQGKNRRLNNQKRKGRNYIKYLWFSILIVSIVTIIIQFLEINYNDSRRKQQDSNNERLDSFLKKPIDNITRKTKEQTTYLPLTPDKKEVIAYVVSLIKCSDVKHTTGFLDSTLILRHSIDLMSQKSKYSYKMYVIIHKVCAKHASLFENIGITPLIRDSPVHNYEIENEDYRKNVESELCCGSAEFIKLYVYTLVEHKAVVMLDMDMVLLQPLDDLFDSMLLSSNKEVRSKLELEQPEYDAIPDKINAFFTRDYTSSWPWKKESGVQAGFMVVRPDPAAFEEYKSIIKIGNYTLGFNNESGWDGKGYGGFIGGKAMQGILPYFYYERHPDTFVELNACRHNQVAASVVWNKRTPRREIYFGKCNRFPRNGNLHTNTNCEDCRNTPIELVKSVHYTACKKPWTCPLSREPGDTGYQARKRMDPQEVNVTMCYHLQRKWFDVRRDFEQKLMTLIHSKSMDSKGDVTKVMETRNGDLLREYFLGYCEGEGQYRPLYLPNELDLKLLYDKIESPLQKRMKATYDNLPKPKWPQLDHDTSNGILNGIIIGSTSKESYLTTVVTAYYDFASESKHPTSQYMTWFPRLLAISDPMIIFIEPNSPYETLVLEKRQHTPTIIVPRKFTDLVMSTTFTDDFWNQVKEVDFEKFRHFLQLYKIWNEKLVFMTSASQMNPFQSEQFVWADAGYFRHSYHAPQFNSPLVTYNVVEKIDKSKVLLYHILNPVRNFPIVAAGNMFLGTPEGFERFYQVYFETFWFLVQNRISVGSDQHVMCFTCYYFRDACQFYSSGKIKQWFDYIKALRNDQAEFTGEDWEYPQMKDIRVPEWNGEVVMPHGVVTGFPS